MRKNHTLSNLPMAAIVLLLASLPCLAQVTVESTSVLAVADNRPTFELNKNSRAVPSREATPVNSKNVERVKRPLNLTPATFKVSDQFSVVSKFFSGTQLTTEVVTPDSKQQFRLDEDTPGKRSKITFVPSRGPLRLN